MWSSLDVDFQREELHLLGLLCPGQMDSCIFSHDRICPHRISAWQMASQRTLSMYGAYLFWFGSPKQSLSVAVLIKPGLWCTKAAKFSLVLNISFPPGFFNALEVNHQDSSAGKGLPMMMPRNKRRAIV